MVRNLKRKDRLRQGLLKLGEIAEITHSLPSTIRYYSNLGLLKISDYTQGKYRLFKKKETVAIILKIKELKRRGLTLTQIRKRLVPHNKISKSKHHKKGFTLIELMTAIFIFSILALAVVHLHTLYATMTKKSTKKAKNVIEYQHGLTHMIENIHNSALIKVIDSNNIELHSHSSPIIRQYKFENNELKFKAIPGDFITIVHDIEADEFFKGIGDERPTNCFNKIEIEFWNKADSTHKEKDIFYIKTYTKAREDRRLIYVGENDTTFKVGTRYYPFDDFYNALDALPESCEDDRLEEKIIVLSDEHTISGVDGDDIVMPCAVCFAPESTVTVTPGTEFKMGKDTIFIIGGGFTIDGTSKDDEIDFEERKKPPKNKPWWWGLYIASTQQNQNLSFFEVEYAVNGVHIVPPERDYSINVAIKNAEFENNTDVGILVNGVKELLIEDSEFEPDVHVPNVSIKLLNDLAPPGDISHNIVDNDFEDGMRFIHIDAKVNPDQTLVQNIHDNNFEEVGEGGKGGVAVYYTSSGSGLVTTKIYNNKIHKAEKPKPNKKNYGIHVKKANNSNSSSKLEIYNNTINGYKKKLTHGIRLRYSLMPIVIRNNYIKDVEQKYWKTGYATEVISCKNVSIKNNIIKLRSLGYGIIVEYARPLKYAGDITINNNIIYGESYLTAVYSDLLSGKKTIFLNNTIASGWVKPKHPKASSWDLRNCIIWEKGRLDFSLRQKAAKYCDIIYTSPDPSKGIISKDPKFDKSDEDRPYDLKNNSPCIDTGDPNILDPDGTRSDMGAYGGPGAALWADGWGAP